jgi:uncharacterized membrane protein
MCGRKGPSAWNQRIWLSLLAAVATLIAIYMGLYQWGFINHVADPIFGKQSEIVLSSHVSHLLYKWARIPDAILGALTYSGDIILALAASSRRWMDRPWLVLLFGLCVIPPAIVSIVLVIIQGAVLNTWCFLCIITAILSVCLIALAYAEVCISFLFLKSIWEKTRSKKMLWNTLWGRPSKIAYQISQNIESKYFGRPPS